jgi:hypothetical protein
MRSAKVSFALLSVLVSIAACDDEDVFPLMTPVDSGTSPTTPDSGTPVTPDASGPTPMADAAAEPDAAVVPVCEAGGSGEIVVEINGLPDGLDAAVSLQGPVVTDAGALVLTESTTLTDSASGNYEAMTSNVVGLDPLVRPLFTPAAPRQLFCLPDGESHSLNVNYQQVATSNKLWALNNISGAGLVSFDSTALSGADAGDAGTDSGVGADAVAGTDLAFDRDGHLWTFGRRNLRGLEYLVAIEPSRSTTLLACRRCAPWLSTRVAICG